EPLPEGGEPLEHAPEGPLHLAGLPARELGPGGLRVGRGLFDEGVEAVPFAGGGVDGNLERGETSAGHDELRVRGGRGLDYDGTGHAEGAMRGAEIVVGPVDVERMRERGRAADDTRVPGLRGRGAGCRMRESAHPRPADRVARIDGGR